MMFIYKTAKFAPVWTTILKIEIWLRYTLGEILFKLIKKLMMLIIMSILQGHSHWVVLRQLKDQKLSFVSLFFNGFSVGVLLGL